MSAPDLAIINMIKGIMLTGIYATFYIGKTIILANDVKIKGLGIKVVYSITQQFFSFIQTEAL